MPNTKLQKEGRFKAKIIEASDRQSSSSEAYAASFTFEVYQWYTVPPGSDEEQWCRYEKGEVVRGDFWIRGSKGTNENAVLQLKRALGWSGASADLYSDKFVGKEVQIQVSQEEYKDTTFFKASWLYPVDAEVTSLGGASNKDRERIAQFDSEFAAICSADDVASGSGTDAMPPAPEGETISSAQDVPF